MCCGFGGGKMIKNIDRKAYLDVLRTFATMGVIVIHVASNNWYGNIGSFDWIIYTIYISVCRISVPIFFMISGALILGKDYTIKDLYLKKIMKLIIFLIMWSLIYKMNSLHKMCGGGKRIKGHFVW